MPNWCYCELSIVGSIEERNRFRKLAEGDEGGLDFNKFICHPERYQIMDEISIKMRESGVDWGEIPKSGFSSGGRDWRVMNWGSKWNACRIEGVIEKPYSLFYVFHTAWTPPRPVVCIMAEMFPKLRFNLKFWERGIGYQGQLMMKDRMMLKEWEGDYSGYRGG